MMPPTPYRLPAGYSVLTGNHNPPVVDAAGTTFWPLNVKKGGPLYFAVFRQPVEGYAEEVLAFPGAGQGAVWVADAGLWASAFRTVDDAVSPPYVGKVAEYVAPPTVDAASILTAIIARLDDPASKVAAAVVGAVAEALTKKSA